MGIVISLLIILLGAILFSKSKKIASLTPKRSPVNYVSAKSVLIIVRVFAVFFIAQGLWGLFNSIKLIIS